jgi:hypothetical protein
VHLFLEHSCLCACSSGASSGCRSVTSAAALYRDDPLGGNTSFNVRRRQCTPSNADDELHEHNQHAFRNAHHTSHPTPTSHQRPRSHLSSSDVSHARVTATTCGASPSSSEGFLPSLYVSSRTPLSSSSASASASASASPSSSALWRAHSKSLLAVAELGDLSHALDLKPGTIRCVALTTSPAHACRSHAL